MSLETLLEAAKYIEYRSEAKARGEVPKDYSSFVGNSSTDHNNGGSGQVFLLPSYSSSNNDDNSPSYYDTESKDRRRSGGAGTREVHNKLEKNRRAHLKKCFETLKKNIPSGEEKKVSNLGVLRSAFRHIQYLKRKERDYEFELERLAREKVVLTQRLNILRRDLSLKMSHAEISLILEREQEQERDNDTNSTSTATECGPLSDVEDDKNSDMSQESVAVSASESYSADKDFSNGSPVGAADVKPVVHVAAKPASSVDVKTMVNANNKSKSLALLANSAEFVSFATVVSNTPPLKASPPKVAATQSAQLAVHTMKPHATVLANNSVTNGGVAGGDVVKTEPQTSLQAGKFPQRTAASTLAVAQSTIATNGNTAPALPTAIKVLAPQTMHILAPVGTTATAPKSMAMTACATTTVTSSRVALAAPVATVPLPALALKKAVPTIKRVTAHAPVTAASSSASVAQSAMVKALVPSAAVGQLVGKSTTVTQQPILTANVVNFQAAAPVAVSSPSAASAHPTTISRVVAATMKPVAQVRSQMAVMAPTSLVSSMGQVIPGGSHVSSIVTPVSVMPSMNRATVAQVISPSQLGKVMGGPFIKTVPIYQQQLFPHLGPVASPTLVNHPIVMVTTPNVVVPATTAAQVTLPGPR